MLAMLLIIGALLAALREVGITTRQAQEASISARGLQHRGDKE